MTNIKIYRSMLLVYLVWATSQGLFAFDIKKTFNFYGHTSVATVCNYNFTVIKNENTKLFAQKMLIECKKQNFDTLIKEINIAQTTYELDDWGKWMYTRKLVEQCFANTTKNQQKILFYYILNKLTYNVQLAYNQSDVFLFAKLNTIPEGATTMQFENNTFVMLVDNRQNLGNIFLYQPYITNKTILSINRYKKPKLNATIKEKIFKFYYNQNYTVVGKLNKSIVEYYADMPLCDLSAMYVNYAFSEELKLSAIEGLKKICQNKTQLEQIGILLAFCQSAVPYKIDEDFFGEENTTFPEETLFNNYADCEDKALLMAKLCKEILNINSVLMYYKDEQHVNLALQLPMSGLGYSFKYKEKTYIICEPAFNGYKIGETNKNLMKIGQVIPMYL